VKTEDIPQWADGLVCLVVVSVFAGVFLYYAL
jgi:hypothetical protein